MTKRPIAEPDPEIIAISDVYGALKELGPEAQTRVLSYVAAKLNLEASTLKVDLSPDVRQFEDSSDVKTNKSGTTIKEQAQDELEGISPVAKKWIARSGLQATQLSQIFSLSSDEIDLIAKTVPGKNKKEKMRSVFLLKGVASYLGSGAARFSHQQMKEVALHYDAFDAANFATYFKSLSSEVSGSKETGYTLTPRGLARATEMVKEITRPSQAI